jgi:uncharacterized membrane protein
MSKQISLYTRGTATAFTIISFGKVDPGATSATIQFDAKNTGTETFDLVVQDQRVGASVLVEGVAATITHKRAAATIGTYTLAWNTMTSASELTPATITDYQVNDILQVDVTWSPAGGVALSPSGLPGLINFVEV